MNRKLELAKKKKETAVKNEQLTSKEIEARSKLLEATENLYELINGQEQYDFDKLHKQLVEIDKRLDLAPYFKSLENTLKLLTPPTKNPKTKIEGFSELLKAVNSNKPIPTKIDLSSLEKSIVNIEQYIREQSKPSDQGAENYQPVRRVIKVGNRFIFDDNFTNAGGGGSGGGSTGGNTTVDNFPTEYPLPAAQVTTLTPPAAITDFATSAKQDTGNTSLSSIDGKLTDVATQTTLALIKAKTDNLDTALSGIKTGTDKIIAAPATSAKQDTGNTSLASLDTKLPAQGQALAAASTPVVLPAAQITALTPPAAITGYATASNQTDKSQFTKITDGTDTALVTASGEQNVLETNSAAIKTAVETIDNIVSGAGINQTQVGGTNIDTNSGTKSAGTQRVVLATDQPQLTNALKVDGSAVTQPVSGTFYQATQPVSYATTGSGTATGALRVELPTNGTGTVGLNAGTNAIGKLSANSGVDIGDVDVTSTVLPTGAGTSSVTSVADTTTSATLIASNSARKEVIITNDSSATLYVKYGTTASSTNYTVSLDRGDSLFEDRYTGRVDGIWATDPNDGAARITEIT